MTDQYTVKPVLSGHSKIDTMKTSMTNCILMKVESIAEPLGALCNTFDMYKITVEIYMLLDRMTALVYTLLQKYKVTCLSISAQLRYISINSLIGNDC